MIELIGSTLLPEEFYFLGFLPLESYINNKKTIKTGVKCPAEKEGIVRALIIKDHLEDLKCTMEELKSLQITKDFEE